MILPGICTTKICGAACLLRRQAGLLYYRCPGYKTDYLHFPATVWAQQKIYFPYLLTTLQLIAYNMPYARGGG